MILLDAFALVALLVDEPAAAEVDALLRGSDCAVTAVNLAETLDVGVRVLGRDPEVLSAKLLQLRGSVLGLVEVGEDEAREAARLRWTHDHHRRTAALSLADCLLLAGARLRGAAVATSDPPLAAAARRESLAVVALPGSTGTRP